MGDRNFLTGVDKALTAKVLTNPDNNKYIWTKVAPRVPVEGSSGVIPVDLSVARDVDINLQPGAETKIISHTGDKITITTQEKGAKEYAKKGDAHLVGGFSNLVELKAFNVTRTYNTFMELLVKTKLTSATNKAALSGTDQWSDDSSKPYEKILDVMSNIEAKGYNPNTLIMGADVFNRLRQHPEILGYMKYVSGGKVASADDLKNLFGVQNIFVSRAVYNTALKGASESRSLILQKLFAVAEVPSAPNWGNVSALYTAEYYPFQILVKPHDERPREGSWVIGYAENDIIEYVADALYVLTSVLA